ncbi:aminoglycoside phosphotransferase family protein, partial [Escherichia coli]
MFMPPVFPAHWHVSQPVLIADTFSSLVWKVSLPDGTPAIVKGLKPIGGSTPEPQIFPLS